MHKRCLLSIVVPSYNAEKTIVRALKSIKVNKFDGFIEVIIVNDGSTDRTRALCEDYIKRQANKRITYKLVNQENAGHGSAINYGIRNARGEYIRVLDSDDYFDSKFLDKYLMFLSRCESDLVITDYVEVNKSTGHVRRFYWHKRMKGFSNKQYDEIISETLPTLLPCSSVKTSLLRRVGGVIDEKCYYDDQEYDFLIIALCDTVSYCPNPVYCYVVGNEAQSVSDNSLIKNIKDHQKVVEWLVRHYYSTSFSATKRNYYFNNILVPLCHHQYHIAVRLKKSRANFLSFDKFLKNYSELYHHAGIAGRRLVIHRLTKGVFI